MLIPDGFLMPGQSDGGIYAMQEPHKSRSKPVRITAPKEGWFYHRAMHIKLPGGIEGILTARATKPLFGDGIGELVWLILPKLGILAPEYLEEVVLAQGPDVMFEIFDMDSDDDTLEVIAAHFFGRKLSIHSIRGKKEHPFVELVESSVIDTVGRPYGLTLATFNPPITESIKKSVDINEGNSFSASQRYSTVNRVNRSKYLSRKREKSHKAMRTSDENKSTCSNDFPTHILVTTHECSYDLKSAVNMAFQTMQGDFPAVKTKNGHVDKASFGKSIPTNDYYAVKGNEHAVKEDSFEEYHPDAPNTVNGGSLFAYQIPKPLKTTAETNVARLTNLFTSAMTAPSAVDIPINAVSNSITHIYPEKTLELANWRRTTLFRGFRVRGWGGIFSPGAPGFPYVFRMPNKPEVSRVL
jgi:hypothetical protein